MLHASTIVSRSTAGILAHLSRLPKHLSKHHLLFSLSSDAPDLVPLVSALTTYSPNTVGCLSAPLPGVPSDSAVACSLAFFDAESTTPFRSTIAGRPAAQVGRWHTSPRHNDTSSTPDVDLGSGNIDWEDVWSRSAGETRLPEGLDGLSPSKVQTLLYFSDGAPEGLSHALQAFPSAAKLGLLASSTPFVTGRPVTLFRNGDIFSSGAVGLALTSNPGPTLSTQFPGLAPITPNLTVTRSEGNLVQELDGANPSRLLLFAIQNMAGSEQAKEDDFYLGVLSPETGLPTQVYKITSGDPSRGTMALESGAAPVEGSIVQLFHGIRSAPPADLATSLLSSSQGRSLTFLTSSADIFPGTLNTSAATQDDVLVLDDKFVAASENGFLLSRDADEVPWTCKYTGGGARVQWSA